MRSARAQRLQRDAIERTARRTQGQTPAPIQLEAANVLSRAVIDTSALPRDVSTQRLQTDDGKDIFLIGYSAMGGPDVMG